MASDHVKYLKADIALLERANDKAIKSIVDLEEEVECLSTLVSSQEDGLAMYEAQIAAIKRLRPPIYAQDIDKALEESDGTHDR